MSKQRFYIATSGNDDQAYKEAMLYACKLADNDPEIKKVVLLVHTKRNTGWYERIFGSGIVKKLFQGTRFEDCKPVFKLETKKTYEDSFTPSEVVVTCALDSDEVFPIDDFYSVKGIIAIPWSKDGLDKWVQTWNPIELRGNQQAVKVYPEPTCVVKKAMQDLTESINMSTGISLHQTRNKPRHTYLLCINTKNL